ncbi:hypothetical protein M406DRAFT_32025, partial [Cryphonectria parasitica EP155]
LETPASPSKNSTIIFLHGFGDDGHGTGYGLAQQFQMYQKLPYTKWVFPTAHVDRIVGQRCWYRPHDLKPEGPVHEAEDELEGSNEEEYEKDEEGILKTVQYIDSLVAKQIEDGVEPGKIVVGGFSQGGAVSTIWGLKGQFRDKVAGVFGLSGYFPRVKAVAVSLPAESGIEADGDTGGTYAPRWFFAHGMADKMIPISLFREGQKRLHQYIAREKVEGHVYENLDHDVGRGELRDLWLWLRKVLEE